MTPSACALTVGRPWESCGNPIRKLAGNIMESLWETIFLMVVRHQLQDFEGGIFLGAVFSLTLKNGLGGLAWIA